LGVSVPKRAMDAGQWYLDVVDIRDFATDRHRSVDDTPAGGGAGMVLRADVVARATDSLAPRSWPRIYVSPRGRPFDQDMAQSWAKAGGVDLLCGRFEGVDERVLEARDFQEISLGDFVLFGGEVAAQAMIEATLRLVPGVIGTESSVAEESFSAGLLEYPHYTRPTSWEGREIPEILLSGHHGRIERWRLEMSESLTKERRQDLWINYVARQAAGTKGEKR